jgi:hypothetical protein
MTGRVNVEDEAILANIASSIRRGHPQIFPQPTNTYRVALVGGGPSLKDTLPELVQAVREGAQLVTVNGAYRWCVEHNLHPKMQIVMDARPLNAPFVDPEIPDCRYVLASQCAPEMWDAVEHREKVWIFHAADGTTGPMVEMLDKYYMGQWFGVGGGTTVISRAIGLLRTLGYLRMDLFGVDSCFLNGEHHAYAQKANASDQPMCFEASPPDRPDLARTFYCAPWHVKQLECLLQIIRVNGQHFLLNVHGDGLLAFVLRTNADLVEQGKI